MSIPAAKALSSPDTQRYDELVSKPRAAALAATALAQPSGRESEDEAGEPPAGLGQLRAAREHAEREALKELMHRHGHRQDEQLGPARLRKADPEANQDRVERDGGLESVEAGERAPAIDLAGRKQRSA